MPGELLIKVLPSGVSDGSGYQDGDVVIGMNARRRRQVHVEHVCRYRDAFNSDGLRPSGHVARDYFEATHQFMFERVGYATVQRTNLWTAEVDVLGPESGTDWAGYIRRRVRQPNHRIFGAVGIEVWFGGRTRFPHAALDQAWAKITEKTGRTEAEDEFSLWPFGRDEIRHFLPVRVADFTDAESEGLVAPQYERDQDGAIVTQISANGEPEPVILARRNLRVDWRAELLDDIGVTESAALDRATPIGRDIDFSGRQISRSKDQPVQASRGKLFSREHGGRLPEVVQ